MIQSMIKGLRVQHLALALAGAALLGGTAVVHAEPGKAREGQRKAALRGPEADSSADATGRKFNGETRKRGELAQEVLATLNLSEDQKNEIRTVLVEARTKTKEWREANADKQKALMEEIKTAREAKDKDKAENAMKQLRELREGAPKPAEVIDNIKALLTAEQREAFDVKIKELREERQNQNKGMMMGQQEKKHEKPAHKDGKGKAEKPKAQEEEKTQDGSLDL